MLRVLQWNIRGLRSNANQLVEAAIKENIDVILLQETMTTEDTTPKIPGFSSNMLNWSEGRRGLATYVRRRIPHDRIENPIPCGEGVEVLAVNLHVGPSTICIYNIYRAPQHQLEIAELFNSNGPMLIGGDFNAHHGILQSNYVNRTGRHLASTLEETNVHLLNSGEPTHEAGGRLDLTLVTPDLASHSKWWIHPTLTSDHYAVRTSIELEQQPMSYRNPPGWNTTKADWKAFEKHFNSWYESGWRDEAVLDAKADAFSSAVINAAENTIPRKKTGRRHKGYWFYCDEIREQNRRINKQRKIHRRNPTPESLAQLREVLRHAKEVSKRVREAKWYEWCFTLDQHSTLGEIWRNINAATGNRPPLPPVHPSPQEEAENISAGFAARARTDNLSADTQEKLLQLLPPRMESIVEGISRRDEADTPFTIEELSNAKKKSKDTAPGQDGITYSMITNLGSTGQNALLNIINESWSIGRLPVAWKKADVLPIPKPKEKGKYRPIALTSCLCKTMERMVLNRLLWKLGPWHPHLFGFVKRTGTTTAIASLLSSVKDRKAVLVFMDLEKAFELANPQAILASLSERGIGGRMLAWVSDYLKERSARVKFQGCLSRYQTLENGTPQGGVLSPTLFNVLMDQLIRLQLPGHSKLFSYADDLVLVVTGANKMTAAQASLRIIEDKCRTLGLKFSRGKSKAMFMKGKAPDRHLHIQDTQLEWVSSYQYLGVWIQNNLKWNKEVQYLQERTSSRISALRSLASNKSGASTRTLKVFYQQAIRSIIDYAFTALVGIGRTLSSKLDAIQNQALRVIFGSPMWTKIEVLQHESGLGSIQDRVDYLVACLVAKTVHHHRSNPFKEELLKELRRDRQSARGGTWLGQVVDSTHSLMDVKRLLRKGTDSLDNRYIAPPPWDPPSIRTHIVRLPKGKKDLSENELLQHTLSVMESVDNPEAAVYYTDGSVDQESGKSGASFVTGNNVYGYRTSDHCSTLQTELAAIAQALKHAERGRKTQVIVYSDSMAALQSLKRSVPNDNVRLISHILATAQSMQEQGRHITMCWIPSHIGIDGNERADKGAKLAAAGPEPTFRIPPSLQQTKRVAKTAARKRTTRRILDIAPTSRQARWYKTASNMQPITITMVRQDWVNLHRIRMGYPTKARIVEKRFMEECSLCSTETEKPLCHYLLDCPVVRRLRPMLNPITDGASMVYRLTENIEKTVGIMRKCPPPR